MSTSRAWYANSWSGFLHDARRDAHGMVRILIARCVELHAECQHEQVAAWETTVQALARSLADASYETVIDGVLLEYPIARMGRRVDVVLLVRGVVVVLEVKAGQGAGAGRAAAQVEDYALSLRDFHAPCHGVIVLPVVWSDGQTTRAGRSTDAVIDGVASTMFAPLDSLAEVLRRAQQLGTWPRALRWRDFDAGAYQPTPTIIEAAQSAYAQHEVRDLRRSDAEGQDLGAAADRLGEIARHARNKKQHAICFVTGEPGAGKTLLGLELVLARGAGQVASEPAALLSGNRPLVHVIVSALAEDAARRGSRKSEAKRIAEGALQNLLDFLRQHTGDDAKMPRERVLVFDEAQRAWDAETGEKLLKRRKSEPELFLDVLGQLPWACLVCLVGPGQEINRGEVGLPLWGEALAKAASSGKRWTIYAAPRALIGDVPGQGRQDPLGTWAEKEGLEVLREPRLHLTNAMRSYRSPLLGKWVELLLAGNLAEAASLASRMDHPPVVMTRYLRTLKSWLADRRRGQRRVGLLASSGAVRLVAEGLPPTPRSRELDVIGHWFLKPAGDYRSSSSLEVPLSEYGVQGLEVDYAGLCWGGDLAWDDDHWQPRAMSAPKWNCIRNAEKARWRMNSYRVLLTRARAGLAIFVPNGSDEDPSRRPQELEKTAMALLQAGATSLD